MSVARRDTSHSMMNGHSANEPVSLSTDPELVLRWILETVGSAQSVEFDDVVETVQTSHPLLPQEDIRIGIWSLLSDGDLELTIDRGLSRV